MNIAIHTVSFVRFSDLVFGLGTELQDAISSHIGDSVTWGDSLHTLIEADAVLSNLDIDDEDETEYLEFRKRLEELPKFVTIDMES